MSYLKEFIQDFESTTSTPWSEYTPEEKVGILEDGTQFLRAQMMQTEKAILAAARDPNDTTAQSKFLGNRRQLARESQQHADLFQAIKTFQRRIESMDQELTREESHDWRQISPLEERYNQYRKLWDLVGGECLTFDQWLNEEGLA